MCQLFVKLDILVEIGSFRHAPVTEKLCFNKTTFRWCSLDRVVYIKAMRMLLKRLQLEVDGEQNETVDVCIEGLGDKSNMMANVIKYCVSTQPVSMHIPLCRLLAGKNLFKINFENKR